jgi:diguanylate cyclase (GGDEF)-like protein
LQPFVESVARITGLRDRDALTSTISQVLYDWLHAPNIAIYGLIGEGQDRRVVLKSHLQAGLEQVAESVQFEPEAIPLLKDMPELEQCVTLNRAMELSRQGHTAHEVLFPVTNGSEVVGILSVEFSGQPNSDHLGLISGVLRIIANMLAVLDYGERDTLTGLLNRKTFDHSFHKMLSTPAVQRRRVLVTPADPAPAADPLEQVVLPARVRAIGLVDIDHFKSINDRFGHLYGDEVLLLLARIMRNNFRVTDQLFRFGGEEFVIALDWTQADHVAAVFERFRIAVERHVFPQIGQVTVSIGVTVLNPFDAPAAAIERADQALYYAKNNGRNRVLQHEALVASGALTEREREADVEFF